MDDPTPDPPARRVASASAALRDGVTHFAWVVRRRDARVLIGWASLTVAAVLTVLAPPSLLSVGLGGVAVVGLARDPQLGVLPAALLALIAIPYGRAADNGLATIASVPLRFHDGVVITAAVLALPTLRRASLRPVVVWLALAWLAIGLIALVDGLTNERPLRDVFRDARWWFLYGFVPLAAWGAAKRPAILRAVLIGATIYTLVLWAAAVLPPFEGALKERAVAYDRGLLRLQFSNSAFVIVAGAYLVDRVLRRPSWPVVGWFALLASGVLLSLTRMSIFILLGVVALSVILAAGRSIASGQIGTVARRAGIATLVLVIPSVLALSAVFLLSSGDVAGTDDGSGNPIDRLFFQGSNAGLDAIARGRGETYRAALELIAERPLLGHGLGTLVEFEFTPGGSDPATPGMQPGVDNAYQTIAMKAGLVGALAFTMLIGWPLVEMARRRVRLLDSWFVVAWVAVLGLTVTQSFATTGYGPFGLALLIVLPELGRRRADTATRSP